MRIDEIDIEIKKLAPIHGVSSDGRVDFKSEATDEQRAAAQNKMAELLPLLEQPFESSVGA